MDSSTALDLVRTMASRADGEGPPLTHWERKTFDLAVQTVSEQWDVTHFRTMFPESGPLRRALYPKHMEFFAAGRLATERCFFGGNRVGKTEGLAFETTCHLTGKYPDWWPGRRWDRPISAIAAGKTNETTFYIVQNAMLGDIRRSSKKADVLEVDRSRAGMIPPGDVVMEDVLWSTSDIATMVKQVYIRYRDSMTEYSMLRVCSYEQGRRAFEGVKVDFAWCDEEVPEDIYSELLVRTATTEGTVALSFTPLDGMTSVVLRFVPNRAKALDPDNEEVYDAHEVSRRWFKGNRSRLGVD